MVGQLVSKAKAVRLRPHDTSTEQGRSLERGRRIALTALSAVGVKSVTFLSLILTVPLTIHYLGTERYGLWLTMSSFLGLLSFADLGLGLGLLNKVAHSSGKDDVHEMHVAISNSFAMLCGLGVLLFSVGLVLIEFMPWESVFNVSSALAINEIRPSLCILLFTTALSLPLNTVQRTQLGLQQGFQTNLWQIMGSLAALGVLVVAMHFGSGLPVLVLALASTPLIFGFGNWAHFFMYQRRDLRPKIAAIDRASMAGLLSIGVSFALLQVGYQFAYSLDNIVVAQVLGPSSVAKYGVALRLFSIVPMAANLVALPLWPAFGEAYARGDITWLKKTLSKVSIAAFLTSLAVSGTLALLAPWIVRHWAGKAVIPSTALVFGLALWVSIDTVRLTLSDFFNAVGVIRFQITLFFVYGIGALLLKVALAERVGLPGIAWASVICFPFLFGIPTIVQVRRFFRQEPAYRDSCPMEPNMEQSW